MRIAMIGQKGMPATHGGVERHVHDLATHLAQAGQDVTVYSRSWYTGKKGKQTIKNVRILHTPSLKTKHFDTFTHTFFATLHAIMHRFDIIHYHGVGPALLAWLPRIFSPRTKVIITFHSIDRQHQKWGWLAKKILRLGERAAVSFAHKTITVSRSLQKYCIDEFKADTSYIPNGINAASPIYDSDILKKFGLQSGNYLLMVSRLIPHKGVHILIDAFTKLKLTNNPNMRSLKLVITGGSAYTNEYVGDLHKQASVCNDIIFTDYQTGNSLASLYVHAKALIHPSLNEGLPIAVLEAMNYGLPVLLSNIPEHLEITNNPRILFKQNNVESLLEKLHWFLNLSIEEQKKLADDSRACVKKNYQWENIFPKIIAAYHSLLPTRS